jgi:hypothetical protein
MSSIEKQEYFCITCLIIDSMAVACLASIAILAGSMAVLYGLDWYKNRRQNRRLTKKSLVDEGQVSTKEEQPIAEQIA